MTEEIIKPSRELSRRDFLKVTSGGAAGVLLGERVKPVALVSQALEGLLGKPVELLQGSQAEEAVSFVDAKFTASLEEYSQHQGQGMKEADIEKAKVELSKALILARGLHAMADALQVLAAENEKNQISELQILGSNLESAAINQLNKRGIAVPQELIEAAHQRPKRPTEK